MHFAPLAPQVSSCGATGVFGRLTTQRSTVHNMNPVVGLCQGKNHVFNHHFCFWAAECLMQNAETAEKLWACCCSVDVSVRFLFAVWLDNDASATACFVCCCLYVDWTLQNNPNWRFYQTFQLCHVVFISLCSLSSCHGDEPVPELIIISCAGLKASAHQSVFINWTQKNIYQLLLMLLTCQQTHLHDDRLSGF